MIGFLLPYTVQCQHPEDSDTFRHAGFVAVGGSFCGEGGGRVSTPSLGSFHNFVFENGPIFV